MTTQVGLSYGVEPEAPPLPSLLNGTFRSSSTIGVRTGFADDTQIMEFDGKAAPERTDAVDTSLTLAESGGIVTGTYTDGTYLLCSVTGTYDGATGAVAFTGSCGDFTVSFAGTLSAASLSGTVSIGATVRSSTEIRVFPATTRDGTPLSIGSAFYVDSVAGSALNDGLTPSTPVDTIANAVAAGFTGGETLRAFRGSFWRESIQGLSACTIEAAGIGPRPAMDCSEVADPGDWSKTGGLTNVYEIAWSAEDTPAVSEAFIVLENGVALTWVADTTTVDATPGSFTGRFTGIPTNIYVHARGSTSPITNGKRYEISSRNHAIEVTGSATIRGILTRANLHDNGSLVVRGVDDANDAPLIYDCVAMWGGKHNLYDCGTADTSRGVRHCVAMYAMPGDTTADYFVTFRTTAATSTAIHPVNYDCAVFGHPAVDVRTVGGGVSRQGCGPYIAHLGSVPLGSYGTAYLTDFGACYHAGYFSFRGGHDKVLTNVLSERQRGGSGHMQFSSSTECTVTATRIRLYNHEADADGGSYNADRRGIRSLGATNLHLTDSIFVTSISVSGGGFVQVNGSDVQISRCLFRRLNSAGTVRHVRALDGAATVTVHEENTYYDGINGFYLDDAGSLLTLNSDHNVVHHPSSNLTVQESSAAALRGFPVYQGDQSRDQNSTNVGPVYEAGTDEGGWDSRPTFVETALSQSTRGYGCGPEPSRPGGSGWTIPPTYAEWRPFVDAQAMPAISNHIESHDGDTYTEDVGADSWPDLTGTGNTPTQGTGGNQPAITTGGINGHDYLTFDGASSNMPYSGDISTSVDYTIYAVARKNGTSSSQYMVDASAGRMIVGYLQNTPAAFDTGNRLIAGPVIDDQWHVIRWEFDGTGGNCSCYVDGVFSATSAWTGPTLQGTIVMGSRNDAAASFLDADLFTWDVFEGVHDTAQSAAVEAYLTAHAGL